MARVISTNSSSSSRIKNSRLAGKKSTNISFVSLLRSILFLFLFFLVATPFFFFNWNECIRRALVVFQPRIAFLPFIIPQITIKASKSNLERGKGLKHSGLNLLKAEVYLLSRLSVVARRFFFCCIIILDVSIRVDDWKKENRWRLKAIIRAEY